jgi:septal ring factor EnvC (AmiA/AmiB activator)
MMRKDVQIQIAELETKLQQLRSSQVTELQNQLKAARQTIVELQAEIAMLADHEVKPYLSKRFQTLSDAVCRCYFITMALNRFG